MNFLFKATGMASSGGHSTGGVSSSASNIQGMLHIPGYMDGKKKKKRKLQKNGLAPLYLNRLVVNGDEIVRWAKSQGFKTTVQPDDLHTTIAYSRHPVEWAKVGCEDNHITVKGGRREVLRLGMDGAATVLRFESPQITDRWLHVLNCGGSWDWPSFRPHVTISFDADKIDLSQVQPYRGPIQFGPEVLDVLKEDWKDSIVEKKDQQMRMTKIGARHSRADITMIQQMHDHAVALGANCGDDEDDDKMSDSQFAKVDDVRICKIDETLGLVMGYAIICKVNGEDYFDKNIDQNGSRVPEHIPEASMLKASADFMQNSRLGNEMHSGPDKGTYVFAWPMTTDIAKAFGIDTNVTGLMVAYKPPSDVFKRFQSGELRGFSIQGSRLASIEVD